MKRVSAELFCEVPCDVAEGPFWYEGRLHWVDIFRCTLFSCDNAGNDLTSIVLPMHLGCVAPWQRHFIAGTQAGIGFLFPDAHFERLRESPRLPPGMRCNDGKLDPAGRFWVGTTTYDFQTGEGALYRVDRDLKVERVLDGLTLPNGLDWDASASSFYLIDTYARRLDCFDWEMASGQLSNRRPAFTLSDDWGLADGMTIDRAGRLWIAFWQGGRVLGLDARSGRPLVRIDVPAILTTSCCLDVTGNTLFITTARSHLREEQLKDQPLAGSVFCADIPY